MSLSGCQDDSLYQRGSFEGNEIAFLVKGNGDWQTRSEENPGSFEIGPSTIMGGDGSNDTIYLHSFVEEGIQRDKAFKSKESDTRSEVAGDDFEFYATAALYRGEWDESAERNEYLHDIRFVKKGQWWMPATEGTYFWPGAGQKLRFFAYGFTNLEDNELGNSYVEIEDENTLGSPRFNYTVSNVTDAQKDLVFSKSNDFTSLALNGEELNTPQLDFDHILTKIVFKADTKIKGTITKITLKNIRSSGSYTLSSADAETWEWICNEDVSSYSQAVSAIIDPEAKETFELEGYSSLFMIPQEFDERSDAQIEVVFKDDLISQTRTLTAKLSDQWKAGTTVTYVLSTDNIMYESNINFYNGTSVSSNNLIKDGNAFTIPIEGGSSSFRIVSQINNKYIGSDNSQKLMTAAYGFTYDFVKLNDNGEYVEDICPTWLSFSMASNTQIVTLIANYLENTGELSQSNQDLRAKKEIGSIESPIYLAGDKGKETTANCYVVNSPGYYAFPAVYGNSLYEGNPNVGAYRNNLTQLKVGTTSAYSNALNQFKNYNGNNINYPWLKEDVGKPNRYVIVWQDAPGLIELDSSVYDDDYIHFYVSQDNIRQGNSVIAALDNSGVIMWSWHIWITDIDINSDTVMGGETGKTITLKNYLGWCDPEIQKYEERRTYLRIRQFNETSLIGEKVLPIVQTGGQAVDKYGSAPSYQWGRKDPMFLPAFRDKWTYKGIYDIYDNGVIKEKAIKYTRSIANSIQYPWKAFRAAMSGGGSLQWCSTPYYNLWGANSNSMGAPSQSSIKTVYDPCPVGFKIPTTHEAGFPKDVNIEYDKSNEMFIFSWSSNEEGSMSNKSIKYMCMPQFFAVDGYDYSTNNKVLNTLDLPTSNFIQSSAKNFYYNTVHVYPNSSSGTSSSASASYLISNTDISQAYGFPIRPVGDETPFIPFDNLE